MRKITFLLIVFCIYILFTSGVKHPHPYQFAVLQFFPDMPHNAQNPVTYEGATLGRYLFYDPSLSFDSSFSCASCHKQKFAFGDTAVSFSTGRNGVLMKRNTPPLFNLAWYPAMFWDGRATGIEEQIRFPLHDANEMVVDWGIALRRISSNPVYSKLIDAAYPGERIDSTKIKLAIAQFLRTLISHRSRFDQVIDGTGRFTGQEYAGYLLMNDQTKGDCLHCHTTDGDRLGTTRKFSNNGLDAVSDAALYKDKGYGAVTGNSKHNGMFKIPSIRNLMLTAPYMHDGRFKSIEEVIEFYSTGVHPTANLDSKMEFASRGGAQLSTKEKSEIVAFLKTLSDSAFISDPEFSNPFTK